MPAIFAASSVETNAHIHLDLITNIFHASLVAIDAPPNRLAMNHNLPELTSPRLIPHYATLLTPSLEALLAADPPLQLERNIYANSSPLTT